MRLCFVSLRIIKLGSGFVRLRLMKLGIGFVRLIKLGLGFVRASVRRTAVVLQIKHFPLKVKLIWYYYCCFMFIIGSYFIKNTGANGKFSNKRGSQSTPFNLYNVNCQKIALWY